MQRISDTSSSSFRLLFIAVAGYLIFSLVGASLQFWILTSGGLSLPLPPEVTLPLDQRQWLRLGVLISGLFTFTVTAVVALWWMYRGGWATAAELRRPSRSGMVVWAAALFVASLPLVTYLTWLNLQLPLPDWAIADEEMVNALLRNLLTMERPAELGLALLTVAVAPAVGEELLLRGVLQQRVFGGLFSGHHRAVWLTALIFSLGHFEFAGFLPRAVLGAALGYACVWTRSLWVPIALHLLFNGAQVLNAYLEGEFRPDTEMSFTPPWWIGVGGLLLCGVLLRLGEHRFLRRQNVSS